MGFSSTPRFRTTLWRRLGTKSTLELLTIVAAPKHRRVLLRGRHFILQCNNENSFQALILGRSRAPAYKLVSGRSGSSLPFMTLSYVQNTSPVVITILPTASAVGTSHLSHEVRFHFLTADLFYRSATALAQPRCLFTAAFFLFPR